MDVVGALPFPLLSLQVDGGSGFMAEFETACEQLRMPPRNGCVERANRTARTEFRSQYAGEHTCATVNEGIDAYLRYYNSQRPHSALGMVTPNAHFATLKEAA